MKFKIACSPRARKSVAKKFISSSLTIGLLVNTALSSLASTLSEDGRYEAFEGTNITIDNILEEDTVDVEIEGNTMVNVANQKDPIPITKSYTVEDTNHISLKGDYDGKARPVIEGNTLVNLLPPITKDIVSVQDGNYKISGVHTGHNFKFDSKNQAWIWDIGDCANDVFPHISLPTDMMIEGRVYSLIVDSTTSVSGIRNTNLDYHNEGYGIGLSSIKKGRNVIKFTYNSQFKNIVFGRVYPTTEIKVLSNFMLLEGDYTNVQIPGYFKGLKSSFEDQLVTQGMVDSGQEKAENLGKYKVEYKVTGKNKFNGKFIDGMISHSTGALNGNHNTYKSSADYISVKPHTNYTISNDIIDAVFAYDKNHTYLGYYFKDNLYTSRNFTTFEDCEYIRLRYQPANVSSEVFQLEEGSTATKYEPYKESIKTFYLNSPLLEGDTIEDINGKATHVKRWTKVVLDGSEDEVWGREGNGLTNNGLFYKEWLIQVNGSRIPATNLDITPPFVDTAPSLEGYNASAFGVRLSPSGGLYFTYPVDNNGVSKTEWLQSHPTTIVYKLATPQYETISEESILLDSYKDGHLDLNSNIPVNKVDFMPTKIKLEYLKPNTEYLLQFECDKGMWVPVSLGDYSYSTAVLRTGINRLKITTPDTIMFNELVFNELGSNISNLVVTEYTDLDFDYFEGIKSAEGSISNKNIEIISIRENNLYNEDEFLSSTLEKSIIKNKEYYVLKGNNQVTESNRLIDDSVFKFKENTQYKLSMMGMCLNYFHLLYVEYTDGTIYAHKQYLNKDEQFLTLTTLKDKTVKSIFTDTGGTPYSSYIRVGSICLNEYDNADSIINSDMIEIPLTQPLRSLPSGVKDRIIRLNGEWFVERNCGEATLNGGVYEIYREINDDFNEVKWFGFNLKNKKDGRTHKSISNLFVNSDLWGNEELLQDANNQSAWNCNTFISISKSKLSSININGFKQWLSENPVTIVYQLEEPTYESLNIDLSLDTYIDKTYIYNNSNIPANMKVTVDRTINRATEAIEAAKANPTVENISLARMWTNLLKESTIKDNLQDDISEITEVVNLTIDKKTATANLDLYIKSSNSLTMSLSTNSITFENYSGVEDLEMFDAVNITVNSSLPYSLNAYMPSLISNADGSNTMDANILNIRDNSKTNYSQFINTTDKVVLKDDCEAGNNNIHNIDLKLSGNNLHEADVYKTVIKFEAVQK